MQVLDELIGSHQSQFLIINGISGIGKSYLCRHWSLNSSVALKYLNFVWIDCTKGMTNALKTTKLLSKLGMPINNATTEKVIDKFSEYNDLLLVLDNFSIEDINILEKILTLPLKLNNIVILSTTKHLISRFESLTISLGPLDEQSAIQLYSRYHKESNNLETIKRIIKLSGLHTLTIEMLSKTAVAGHYSDDKFYEILKQNQFDLSNLNTESIEFEKDGENENEYMSQALLKLFDLSSLTQAEKDLLYLLSCLELVPFNSLRIKDWFDLNNFEEFNNICRKGWVTTLGNNMFVLHNVITYVLRFQLTKDGFHFEQSLINNIIAKMRTYIPIPERWYKHIENIDSFDHVGSFAHRTNLPKYFNLSRSEIFERLAKLYTGVARYDSAITYSKLSILCSEEFMRMGGAFFKKFFFHTAYQKGYLAEIYRLKGEPQKAVSLIKECISIRQKEAQPSLALAICLSNMGQVLIECNELSEVLSYLDKSLNLKKTCIGNNIQNVVIFRTYFNYARYYEVSEDIAKAKEYYDLSLEACKQELGYNDAEYWVHNVSIATFYSIHIDVSIAKKMIRNTMHNIGRLISKNHPFYLKVKRSYQVIEALK